MSFKTTKKYCVFTHQDLDGVVTYLVLTWFYPNTVFELVPIKSAYDFRQVYLNWCLNHKPDEYENIFILDLDVGGNEDLIDRKNFFIVDHHLTHENTKYQTAKAFVKKYSSACKLLWKVLSAKFPNIELTVEQKKLIALTDDYDSYSHKIPISKKLNILYWNLSDNFNSFAKQFSKGFFGFTTQHQTLIKIYNQGLHEYYNNIKEIFHGQFNWNNKQYSCVSFFADKYINDLADMMFESQKCDLIFMCNLKSNKVYVRKSRSTNSDINVGRICEQWGGGGHEGAGGAPITQSFLEFSKTLQSKSIN